MTRPQKLAPILILLIAMLSCSRFAGDTAVAKPTQVVDFSTMAGKSFAELTTLLGQASPQESCFRWEMSEGKLVVCYETRDYKKKLMSSISYYLSGRSGDEPGFGVGTPAEMMQLINMSVDGKDGEQNRRVFYSYGNFVMNDRSCFIDIHPRGSNSIFGSDEPVYVSAQMYIHHPHIYLNDQPDQKGTDVQFYEEEAYRDLTVKSILIGHGSWELCTEQNFLGNCKILDPIDRFYLENSKNLSAFGLGEKIRSLRPLPDKPR